VKVVVYNITNIMIINCMRMWCCIALFLQRSRNGYNSLIEPPGCPCNLSYFAYSFLLVEALCFTETIYKSLALLITSPLATHYLLVAGILSLLCGSNPSLRIVFLHTRDVRDEAEITYALSRPCHTHNK
jgi:hypothetical protein